MQAPPMGLGLGMGLGFGAAASRAKMSDLDMYTPTNGHL